MKKINHNHSAILSYFCILIIYLSMKLCLNDTERYQAPSLNDTESCLALGMTPPKNFIQTTDLETVSGISTKKAKLIYKYLNSNNLNLLEKIDWNKIKGIGDKTAQKINQQFNKSLTPLVSSLD